MMFDNQDDTQMVPQQQLAVPTTLDVAYGCFPGGGNDSFLEAKPLPSSSAGLVLPGTTTHKHGASSAYSPPPSSLPSSSSSLASSASGRCPKPTGFDSLDQLGLLDGLISPRGVTTPSGINTPSAAMLAGSFFGADYKPPQAPQVPQHVGESHVLSCSSTPSQSPTFDAPRMRLPASAYSSPVPQAAAVMPASLTPIETSVAATDVATPAQGSAATRRSRRQSAKGPNHRASTAASARKQAAAPVIVPPKTRAPRGTSKAALAKAAKAKPRARAAKKGAASKTAKSARAVGAKAKAKVGKKAKKKVSTAAAAAVLTASLSQLDGSGALPANHKPARGRGRQLQLAQMTPAQRAAEAKARLEKNRQAARGFRARRKDHIQDLEDKVTAYEDRDQEQQRAIKALHAEIDALRQLLTQQ